MRIGETKGVGRRMKAARVLAGLEQREMAERLGCSQAWLSQMENGRASVNVDWVFKYAEITKANASWIVGGTGDPMEE